jgi:hypothetical protein
MSRSHFTALAAALALGAFAPRLTAQDTSSTTPTRPDTSGYTRGAGGIDTSASPGRIGATDTTVGGAVDTSSSRIKSADSSTVIPQPPSHPERSEGDMPQSMPPSLRSG